MGYNGLPCIFNKKSFCTNPKNKYFFGLFNSICDPSCELLERYPEYRLKRPEIKPQTIYPPVPLPRWFAYCDGCGAVKKTDSECSYCGGLENKK
jgi:hypothetical protein